MYKIGQEISQGKRKFMILKVNKKTILVREFTRKKGQYKNTACLEFGEKFTKEI